MFACFRTTRQKKLYICNPLPLQSAVCALCEKTVKRLTAILVPVVLLACFLVQMYKTILKLGIKLGEMLGNLRLFKGING